MSAKHDMYKDLNKLLVLKGNDECADCPKKRPTWASVNLGIFICTECAGIHRSLGTHITFVQSTKMDKWKEEWYDTCRFIGNNIGRRYYEHSVPPGHERPTAVPIGGDCLRAAETAALKEWIRNKYEKKLYAPNMPEPWEYVRMGKDPAREYRSLGQETQEEQASPPSSSPERASKEKKHKKEKKEKKEKKKKDKKDAFPSSPPPMYGGFPSPPPPASFPTMFSAAAPAHHTLPADDTHRADELAKLQQAAKLMHPPLAGTGAECSNPAPR